MEITDKPLASDILGRIIEDQILPLLDAEGWIVMKPDVARKMSHSVCLDGSIVNHHDEPSGVGLCGTCAYDKCRGSQEPCRDCLYSAEQSPRWVRAVPEGEKP